MRFWITACLAGESAVAYIKKEVGAAVGLPVMRAAAVRIVQRVGIRAFGQAPTRAIPLVGGLVGMTVDAATCRSIAGVGRRQFPRQPPGRVEQAA